MGIKLIKRRKCWWVLVNPMPEIIPLTNHDWGSIYIPNYKLKFWMVLLKVMGYDPSITLW